jgi:hypothetical protein
MFILRKEKSYRRKTGPAIVSLVTQGDGKAAGFYKVNQGIHSGYVERMRPYQK